MNNYWMELLTIVLEAAIPALLVIGGVVIIKWAKKRGANEDELYYLETAYSLLTRAVTNTNQVWVDALKKSQGHLTDEQQAEARLKTEEAFKAMLTDSVQLAIEAAYGSVDKWLAANMESAVGLVKSK